MVVAGVSCCSSDRGSVSFESAGISAIMPSIIVCII
jgi:hypothetical protein